MSDYDHSAWNNPLHPDFDPEIHSPYRSGNYTSSSQREAYYDSIKSSKSSSVETYPKEITINNDKCKESYWRDRPCEYVCSFCKRTIPELCRYFPDFKKNVSERKAITCEKLIRTESSKC